MIRLAIFLLCTTLLATSVVGAPTTDPGTTKTIALKPQTHCPISGKALEGSRLHADVAGYRIYTRSTASVEAVKSDPQKAIRTLLARGEAPEVIAVAKPQSKCPIMGDEVTKRLFVDAYGYRIYVCCSMCVRQAAADPDKAIRKILDNGETPEPRPILYVQSKDPITGEPIVKTLYVDDKDGHRIYVADQASLAIVKADPEKAIERILANGEGVEQIGTPGAAK